MVIPPSNPLLSIVEKQFNTLLRAVESTPELLETETVQSACIDKIERLIKQEFAGRAKEEARNALKALEAFKDRQISDLTPSERARISNILTGHFAKGEGLPRAEARSKDSGYLSEQSEAAAATEEEDFEEVPFMSEKEAEEILMETQPKLFTRGIQSELLKRQNVELGSTLAKAFSEQEDVLDQKHRTSEMLKEIDSQLEITEKTNHSVKYSMKDFVNRSVKFKEDLKEAPLIKHRKIFTARTFPQDYDADHVTSQRDFYYHLRTLSPDYSTNIFSKDQALDWTSRISKFLEGKFSGRKKDTFSKYCLSCCSQTLVGTSMTSPVVTLSRFLYMFAKPDEFQTYADNCFQQADITFYQEKPDSITIKAKYLSDFYHPSISIKTESDSYAKQKKIHDALDTLGISPAMRVSGECSFDLKVDENGDPIFENINLSLEIKFPEESKS